MGKSLQDQLLKAGLANKKQAVRAKKAKNNKEKQLREGKQVEDETQQAIKATDEQKLARDRELNRQKEEQIQQKAIQAQIVQLVELNRIEERGDDEFSFNDSGKIKTIMLSPTHRKAIIGGQLALVKTADDYNLVPKKVADKIAERDADAILVNNAIDSGSTEEDDEYADFKIPDDLMW